MWQGEGAWIALGISAFFLLVAWWMHRIFVRILKTGASEPGQKENHE